jgi:pyruvate formate lyase activating enzyme
MNDASTTLADTLDRLTRPGELYHRLEDGSVRCFACAHRCLIRPGRRGVCQVRFNREGVLYVPHGYAAGVQIDPIEKKPFNHVMPGSDALTFGMLGCDLHCSYCQNWVTSQFLRDSAAISAISTTSASNLVEAALRSGASTVVSSYNEPLITAEWATEVFRQARGRGLLCGFVSNGNATAETLDFIRPWAQCYKIDLKTMNDRNYRQLGAVLSHILDGIGMVHERGFWLEIVTLVIPGFNDSKAELRQAAEFIASVSPDIPWHVTAFHQDYKMTDPRDTTARDLVQAAEIGKEAGLRFVYAGNLPGRVGPWENTYCPVCNHLLIERYGYVLLAYHLTSTGDCPACGARIPGLWPRSPAEVRLGETSGWFSRTPKRVRV